jgi:hypothetical protein
MIDMVNKKKGRVPLHRGTLKFAGTKKHFPLFWNHKNSIEMSLDDNIHPTAQPGGNYLKTKLFLKNEWKHVNEFVLSDLKDALGVLYPEKADYNGFRLQRWHEAYYWSITHELAIKPIYKKATYRTYYNIFYIEPETAV